MKYLYVLAAACLVFSMASCEKKKEPCAAGYEGAECTTLSKDKMAGLWQGDEECVGIVQNYKFTIESLSNPLSFTLRNLNNNENWIATGNMTGPYTFNFGGSVDDPKSSFSGTGVLDSKSGVLILKYKYKIGSAEEVECRMQSARK